MGSDQMGGNPVTRYVLGLALALLASAFLAGCQVSEFTDAKHLVPIPADLKRKMERLDMDARSPILVRIFKEESELEVWKAKSDGKYALLKTYNICAWSGDLGPKIKEGDRQSPEGFYTIHPYQMNPNSSYYLSFDLGFPNAYDRSYGRTGSYLMVHGACSSAGCYSMEDDQIAEIYALAREAFRGGQQAFQVQAFPFRMTPENMARHWQNPNMPFWVMLKEGYDHFEVTHRVPEVGVCDYRYVFDASAADGEFVATEACPAYHVPEEIAVPLVAKQEADDALFRTTLASLYSEAGVVAALEQGYGPATILPAAYLPVGTAVDPVVTATIEAAN